MVVGTYNFPTVCDAQIITATSLLASNRDIVAHVKNESAADTVYLRRDRSYFTLLPILVSAAGVQEDRRKRVAGTAREGPPAKAVGIGLSKPLQPPMEDIENREPMPVGGPPANADTLTPPITPSPPPLLPGVGDKKDPFVRIAKPVLVDIPHSEEVMIPSSDESGGSTASSIESGVVLLQEEEEEDGREVPSSQELPPDDYEDIAAPADQAGGGNGTPPAPPVEELDLQPVAGQEEVEEEEEEEEAEEGGNAAPLP
jgi:hypothetical protein